MGVFDRLFSIPRKKRPTETGVGPTSSTRPTRYRGDETLEVVGESQHQDALWGIVGGRRSERVRHEVVAELVPEPDNIKDENAIKIRIADHHVGYLSRDDAAVYKPGLLALIIKSPTGRVALEGVIVGGGARPDGPGMLGVFLNHDPSDFGIVPAQPQYATRADLPPSYGFRTGFSSARATDMEDESYNLSWYESLSTNVATAITQLNKLLESEPDPIDRHYMMAELEERLYRCRDAFASALDEYDEVCRQHDAEMDWLRQALFEKFGRLPILDIYRQAAVRFQKARDWESVRRWCERGLSVYGDDAANPEVIDDLRKRLDHAIAKIDDASRPKPPRGRVIAASPTTEIETLVCTVCGTCFERARTRGRKPKACPSCRRS